MISQVLPVALSDPDPDALKAGFQAFQALMKKCKKEEQGNYLEQVRDIILKEVSDDRGEEIPDKLLPGLLIQGGLEPYYPIYQHGLMYGTPEIRLMAAQGLGELVTHITEEALKPFVVKITGPLIRIVGDRFAANVKLAIIATLETLLKKGGAALKPFLPQLQTTYVKCLTDLTSPDVREQAAKSLGVLIELAPRVDSLLAELAAGVGGATPAAVRTQLGADLTDEKKTLLKNAMGMALFEVIQKVPAEKFKDALATKVVEAVKNALSDEGVREWCEKVLKVVRARWPELAV